MAITIYKLSSYINWRIRGTAGSVGSIGGGTCDLSNYYTKSDLQTEGLSIIDFHNIANTDHNELGNLQGGLVVTDSSGTPSSGGDDEFYHLDFDTYSRVTSWIFDDSVIEESDGTIHLVNDTAPAPDQYYGTDSGGERGWFDLPEGGGFYTFIDSIEEDSLGNVALVGDEDTPGNNQVYGTDGSGVKGWYELAETGGVSGVGDQFQVAVFQDETSVIGSAGLTYDGANLNVSGTITSSADMTSTDFDLTSDERLKTNIKDLQPERMDTVYKQFELKSQPGRTRYGVIAQELMQKYPELVKEGIDGMLSVSYFDLLIREIVFLKEKVRQLEKLIDNE
jgi:hypothetical protein